MKHFHALIDNSFQHPQKMNRHGSIPCLSLQPCWFPIALALPHLPWPPGTASVTAGYCTAYILGSHPPLYAQTSLNSCHALGPWAQHIVSARNMIYITQQLFADTHCICSFSSEWALKFLRVFLFPQVPSSWC